MNVSLALKSPCSLCHFPATIKQQESILISTLIRTNATVADHPVSMTNSLPPCTISCLFSSDNVENPTVSSVAEYSTPKSKLENQMPTQAQTQMLTQTQTQMPEMSLLSPISAMGKQKRCDSDDNLLPSMLPTPSKRKTSGTYLRKGQWTNTEEKLTRLLIEAFEDGSLPICTGTRLRGYLAVQLQCDPMRVSKKLCTGSIHGKKVPKNYGQKKFKLRKEDGLESDKTIKSQIKDLEKLTTILWSEARMSKPAFLTLSSTCNVNKRWGSSSTVEKNHSPTSTVKKSKKQKVFPIIYLNLSKSKRYTSTYNRDDPSSERSLLFKNLELDTEPVRLDGESLQAAYDLLALCSLRSSYSKDSNKGKCQKGYDQQRCRGYFQQSKVQ